MTSRRVPTQQQARAAMERRPATGPMRANEIRAGMAPERRG